MRILIVEDNPQILRVIRQGLEEEGFAVDTATEADEADVKCRTTAYDVIILDRMIPKVDDAMTLLRRWRAAGIATHVLMLTAKTQVQDRVAGLDSGADDYLTKPFEFQELLARIRALVRRTYQHKDPIIRCFDLEIDTASRTVRRSGQVIHLTPREYSMLEFLAYHRGKLVTRSMFWEHLYDEIDEDNTSNVVDVYIRYLRNKIDKNFDLHLILTRWGEGYMLRGEDDIPPPNEKKK